jgi:hypothetical protein
MPKIRHQEHHDVTGFYESKMHGQNISEKETREAENCYRPPKLLSFFLAETSYFWPFLKKLFPERGFLRNQQLNNIN